MKHLSSFLFLGVPQEANLETQNQTPRVQNEKAIANEDEGCPKGVLEGETAIRAPSGDSKQSISSTFRSIEGLSGRKLAMTSSSTVPDPVTRRWEPQDGMTCSINDNDRQQRGALDRINSALVRPFTAATRSALTAATEDTPTAPLVKEGLDGFFPSCSPPGNESDQDDLVSFSSHMEANQAIRNAGEVNADIEFTTTTPSLAQEMDIFSSGEESFVFNSQSPPCMDSESEREIENLASGVVQDLMQGFVSASRGMNLCTPPTSQGSSTSSNCGEQVAVGSRPSTEQAAGITRSSEKKKRRAHDNKDEPRRPRRPRIESPIPDDIASDGLLACPYAKYDPNRYSEMNQNLHEKPYRRCRSVCLTNIPRLKQHLYRVHRRPEYYCSSCYAEFESESECGVHARARPACILRDCPFQEKMSHEQYKAVKRRKMRREATSVWFGIFDILFPGAKRPHTPYVDCANSPATMQSVRDYNTFLENHLPQRLSERMGGPLFGGDPMMFQWLVNMALEETLPTVLRELQDSYQTPRSAELTDDDSS
ncbi:uncharacterized protein A1O5_09033 [Cladophialophora psammophila CBS 110553]|uniref:C2H2-type domain-containing protein n=1 Tax=Cladophialophora psammophila CBS 110553 TaxID=1182543 RepID=W9WHS2_9EURO|nr:uncharacterized protein A1O5_09033 [Cladophialophora psammophila CBS 110553]EXJ67687.1 hypothetical protein A1O5_09033 [Cladophialophora psammophila CBS 110553]